MGKVRDWIHGSKPAMVMVGAQIALTVNNILYKLAGSNGSSLPVVIAYRFIFAAATIVPLALIFDRKKRPKLTWGIAFQAFICALFGCTITQNLFAASLMLTSATFASAMTNLIPAVTFILAVLFRLESLGLNTNVGKAKVMGTLLCIGGAMLLTFYKGCEVKIWSTHFDLVHKYREPGGHVAATHHKSSDNILGLVMALACCLCASISLIVQAKMSNKYPCHYSSTALITTMASVQTVVFAICMERNWSQWKLGWNLRLFTVAYMGIVASGIVLVYIMSCVKIKGPLFVSIFNPLMLVLVALAGSLLLDEKLHLGSVLGGAIIICGLYAVLWGKGKEMKKISRLVQSKGFQETSEVGEIAEVEQSNGFQETSEVGKIAEVEQSKGFQETSEVGEIAKVERSFNGLNHGINAMAVTPNLVTDRAIIEILDDGEDENTDLEAANNNICNPDQTKPPT